MRVTELPAEEVAKLREKVEPVVDKHSAEADPELVKPLQAELEKARVESWAGRRRPAGQAGPGATARAATPPPAGPAAHAGDRDVRTGGSARGEA